MDNGKSAGRCAVLTVFMAVLSMLVAAPAMAPSPVGEPGCEKPAVVLVHGAFADASSWSGEVQRLRTAGYVVRAIANPLRGLTYDAASVAAFLKTLPGPIVLAGHSYGGSVITNAAAGIDAVKQLVYVDASAPAVGETSAQTSGATSVLHGDPATLFESVPNPGGPEGDADVFLREDVFLESFGPDLPAAQARALWASQRPAAMSAFSTPSSAAAWQTIPSWYVIGGADQIITPQSQMLMAQRAKSRFVVVPGGSHLTLISHPEAVTDQILAAARAVCEGG